VLAHQSANGIQTVSTASINSRLRARGSSTTHFTNRSVRLGFVLVTVVKLLDQANAEKLRIIITIHSDKDSSSL
jgi:uncharacterized membrane protein YdcZ (DUF606 family)